MYLCCRFASHSVLSVISCKTNHCLRPCIQTHTIQTTAFRVPWKMGHLYVFPLLPWPCQDHFYTLFLFFKPGDPVSIAFSHQAGVQSTQAQSTTLQFQLKHLCFTWLSPSPPSSRVYLHPQPSPWLCFCCCQSWLSLSTMAV